MTKHIFVTGGVVSSLGKGITAASLAMLLRHRGYCVAMQKLDPYINVDPGTMSPYQHGEVYVTDDGAETDLDLGHYERFAGVRCSQASNYTTGRIYSNVITREREGGYLGGTVQVVPHITDEIKKAVASLDSPDNDITITEIGGTAGDIESLPFLEAIRQFYHGAGPNNSLFIHLTLVPYIKAAGEMKTKPSQQSVGILRNIGIVPDILICRTEKPMQDEHFSKLALFCNINKEFVIEERDVENSIYEVPIELAKQEVDLKILEQLHLDPRELDITDWKNMVERIINHEKSEATIAVVGKYISLRDAYKSIYEALDHAGIANDCKINILMIEAEELEAAEGYELISKADGILVPGGFGDRGIPGKLKAIQYARENNIPFLGICLGMQCAVIEFARNVLGYKGANSTEFDKSSEYPVIDLMLSQKDITNMGGTMRLGAYPCTLSPDTNTARAYDNSFNISERHRHRFEFNNNYREAIEDKGLKIVGTSPDGKLVEMVELAGHPWFIACQFHPEFKSRPLKPHPLFKDFIKAALKK